MSIKNIIHLWVFILIFTAAAASQAQEPPPAAAKPASPQSTVVTPEEADAKTGDKPTPLDNSVAPAAKDEIPGVFKNMVVVQRKAKKKADHWLFAPSFTIDFSDGPITAYAISTDIGYALNDFWEVYLNAVPAFLTIERPIVQKVKDLGPLQNGTLPSISYAKPTTQFGANILWLPAYGKESWGAFSIVRSDTFLKFGASEVNFQGGGNGLRFGAEVGKTYFISNWLNVRVSAGVAYAQSVVDGQKNFNWVPVLETGLVYYF